MIRIPLGEFPYHIGVRAVENELMFSPANAEAAQLYKDNTKEYERRVKVSLPGPMRAEADKEQTVEQSWVDNNPEGSGDAPMAE